MERIHQRCQKIFFITSHTMIAFKFVANLFLQKLISVIYFNENVHFKEFSNSLQIFFSRHWYLLFILMRMYISKSFQFHFNERIYISKMLFILMRMYISKSFQIHYKSFSRNWYLLFILMRKYISKSLGVQLIFVYLHWLKEIDLCKVLFVNCMWSIYCVDWHLEHC